MLQYQEKSRFAVLGKILFAALGMLAGFIICRIFIVSFTMPDDSMLPGLKAGEFLLVLKHVTPAPGDIVMLDSPVEPGTVLIKRVAAVEGDTVEIRDRIIRINGAAADFKWKTKSADKRIFPMNFTYRDNMPAVKMNRNEYFVLCDNLDRGFDSRTLGIIPGGLISGRLIYRYQADRH